MHLQAILDMIKTIQAACPLKNNGILFHKAKHLNLTCIIKNIYKAKTLCELCQNESCL